MIHINTRALCLCSNGVLKGYLHLGHSPKKSQGTGIQHYDIIALDPGKGFIVPMKRQTWYVRGDNDFIASVNPGAAVEEHDHTNNRRCGKLNKRDTDYHINPTRAEFPCYTPIPATN